MLVPSSFTAAIADTFYDKTVTKLTRSTTTDSEGGVKKTTSSPSSTFKGNVRFEALGEVQSELGLTEKIDIAITCPPDTAVSVDDIIEYLSVKYVATSVLPRDTHKLIVGQRWQGQ